MEQPKNGLFSYLVWPLTAIFFVVASYYVKSTKEGLVEVGFDTTLLSVMFLSFGAISLVAWITGSVVSKAIATSSVMFLFTMSTVPEIRDRDVFGIVSLLFVLVCVVHSLSVAPTINLITVRRNK